MILKRLLSVSENETNFKKRGFAQINLNTVSHLETIGRFFLLGYHLALSIKNTSALVFEISKKIKFYSVFYF
jgi:hypothetical protein